MKSIDPLHDSLVVKNGSRLLLFACAATFALNAQAQQKEETADDIFEISPFVITEEEDSGYIATQTLAGTRIRSSLQDIGASVQVITSEFLDDIGATEANDLLLFTTSTETSGLGGNFSGGEALADNRVNTNASLNNPQSTNRIRGLGGPDTTRDFFITDIPFDSYNTGRVEVNRGANAILFGLGSPSGVLNAGLNKAVFDDINEVDFRVQDGGKQLSTRASVDFNRVLIEDKLAIRFSAMQSDRNYSQEPTFQDQERYYLATTYLPFENTTIRANYENGHIRANTPDSVGPLQAIDEYLRVRDRMHQLQLQDPNLASQPLRALTYDPWRRATREKPNRVFDGFPAFGDPFGNAGFGQSLGMVWGSATEEPDFGFVAVIPNGNIRDVDPNMNGFQNPAFYDFDRPYPATNARATVGANNFRRIDNAGARTAAQGSLFNGIYEGFNDLDLFDFSKNLLAGSAPFQNRDFDALNLALEQTFWNNKAGFELAYSRQSFKRANFNGFPGQTMGIMIDLNETLPIGSFNNNNDVTSPTPPTANPNFGRPFMVGKASEGRFNSEREVWRWTGFAEFDTAQIFGDESIWSSILGRHIFTALASRQDLEVRNVSYSMREFGPREANLNENFGTNTDPRHFDYLVYMGPAVDLLSDPAGLTREDFKIEPLTNQNVWNPGGAPVMTTYFDTVTQNMVTYPIERRLTPVNGQLTGTTNDSLAVIMQSYLLNENIVGTMGWRQDEVTNDLTSNEVLIGSEEITDQFVQENGITNNDYHHEGTMATNANGDLFWEEPELTIIKEDIFSWGAVAKLPQKWNPFGWLSHASAFYSSSSNFQPQPGRKDHLGSPLPSPTGDTTDYGFNFAFADNKYSLRINKFEAAINNANYNSVNTVYGRSQAGAVYGFFNTFYSRLATQDFNELEDDETSPYFGQPIRLPLAEAEALLNEFMDHIGVTIDRYSGQVTLDTSNPLHQLWLENNWRAEFNPNLGVVDGIGQSAGNPTDTLDQVSKGYEFELVANPIRGLRLLVNAARVETSNSNIAPTMRAWIEEEYGPFYAGTPNNPSKFGAVHRGQPELRPELYPNDNTNVTWWQNNVIFDWETIKAQEGTFSPEVRKWRYNGVVNYDFQNGFLKGFGTGFNVRYQSKVAIGFPYVADEEGVKKPDISSPFYGPSEIEWGFRFAYSKRIFDDKVRWRVQLNLSNVFSDERDLIPVRVNETGLYAQSRTAPPKGWILSNTFNF